LEYSEGEFARRIEDEGSSRGDTDEMFKFAGRLGFGFGEGARTGREGIGQT
jgi:hypothetical protein